MQRGGAHTAPKRSGGHHGAQEQHVIDDSAMGDGSIVAAEELSGMDRSGSGAEDGLFTSAGTSSAGGAASTVELELLRGQVQAMSKRIAAQDAMLRQQSGPGRIRGYEDLIDEAAQDLEHMDSRVAAARSQFQAVQLEISQIGHNLSERQETLWQVSKEAAAYKRKVTELAKQERNLLLRLQSMQNEAGALEEELKGQSDSLQCSPCQGETHLAHFKAQKQQLQADTATPQETRSTPAASALATKPSRPAGEARVWAVPEGCEEVLETKLRQLQAQNREVTANREMAAEIREPQRQLKQLQTGRAAAEQGLAMMMEERSAVAAEVDACAQQLAALQAAKGTAAEDVVELQKRKNSLTADAEALEQQLSLMQQSKQEAEKAVHVLGRETTSLAAQAESFKQHLAALQADRVAAEERAAEMQRKADSLSADVQQLEANRLNQEAAVAAAAERLADLQRQSVAEHVLQEENARLTHISAARENLAREVEGFQASKASLKSEVEAIQASKTGLQAEIASMQAQLAVLQEENRSLEDRLPGLALQVLKAEEEGTMAHAKVAASKEEHKRLEEKWKTIQREITDAESIRATVVSETQQLRDKFAEVQSQNITLDSSLYSERKQIEAFQHQKANLLQDIAIAEEALSAIKLAAGGQGDDAQLKPAERSKLSSQSSIHLRLAQGGGNNKGLPGLEINAEAAEDTKAMQRCVYAGEQSTSLSSSLGADLLLQELEDLQADLHNSQPGPGSEMTMAKDVTNRATSPAPEIGAALERQIANMQETVCKLQEQIAGQQKLLRDLEAEVEHKRSEVRRLNPVAAHGSEAAWASPYAHAFDCMSSSAQIASASPSLQAAHLAYEEVSEQLAEEREECQSLREQMVAERRLKVRAERHAAEAVEKATSTNVAYKEAQGKLHRASTAYQRTAERLDAMIDMHRQLRKQHRAADHRVQELTAQAAQLASDQASAHQRLADAQQSIMQKQEDFAAREEQLVRSLCKAEETAAAVKAELARAEADSAAHAQQNAVLQQELAQMKQEADLRCKGLETELIALKEQLEDQTQRAEATEAALVETQAQVEAAVAEIAKRLQQAESSKQGLQASLSGVEAANEELLARLRECQAARAETSNRLDESQAARSLLTKRLQEAETARDGLAAQYAKANAAAKEHAARLGQSEAWAAELEGKCEAVAAEKEVLQAQLASCEKHLSDLQGHLQAAEDISALSRLQAAIGNSGSDAAGQTPSAGSDWRRASELQRLQHETHSKLLEADLATLSRQVAQQQSVLASVQSEVQQARTELQQVDAARDQLQVIQQQLLDLESELGVPLDPARESDFRSPESQTACHLRGKCKALASAEKELHQIERCRDNPHWHGCPSSKQDKGAKDAFRSEPSQSDQTQSGPCTAGSARDPPSALNELLQALQQASSERPGDSDLDSSAEKPRAASQHRLYRREASFDDLGKGHWQQGDSSATREAQKQLARNRQGARLQDEAAEKFQGHKDGSSLAIDGVKQQDMTHSRRRVDKACQTPSKDLHRKNEEEASCVAATPLCKLVDHAAQAPPERNASNLHAQDALLGTRLSTGAARKLLYQRR